MRLRRSQRPSSTCGRSITAAIFACRRTSSFVLGDAISPGSPSAATVEREIVKLRAQLTATRDRALAELSAVPRGRTMSGSAWSASWALRHETRLLPLRRRQARPRATVASGVCKARRPGPPPIPVVEFVVVDRWRREER